MIRLLRRIILITLLVCQKLTAAAQSNGPAGVLLVNGTDSLVLTIETRIKVTCIDQHVYRGYFQAMDNKHLLVSRSMNGKVTELNRNNLGMIEILNDDVAKSRRRRICLPIGILIGAGGGVHLYLASEFKKDEHPLLHQIFLLNGIIGVGVGTGLIAIGATGKDERSIISCNKELQIIPTLNSD